MDDLRLLLDTPLDTENGHLLAEQLAERAAWQARISTMYREAESKLMSQRARIYGLGGNMDEKKINMDAGTAAEQKEVNTLKDLSDILKMHISLGQSLIRNLEGEMRLK